MSRRPICSKPFGARGIQSLVDTTAFVLIASLVFGFGLGSKRLANSSLTPPLVFVGCGILLGPVAIALIGSGVRVSTVLFLGWFGPRGLASILFGLLIVRELDLAHEALFFEVEMLTVLLSVVAHGVSAAPLARRYGQAVGTPEACPVEHEPAMEHPLRVQI